MFEDTILDTDMELCRSNTPYGRCLVPSSTPFGSCIAPSRLFAMTLAEQP